MYGHRAHRYNPGLAVSLVLNIPIGTAAVLILIYSEIGSIPAWTVSVLIAIGLMAFIAGYAIYQSRRRPSVGQ